jgi:flagellar biosynthesis protein FlhF
MQIKKFVGASVKEASDQMKEDLGCEAIILATKKVSHGGLFKFREKEMYEITAAIDDIPGPANSSLTYGSPMGMSNNRGQAWRQASESGDGSFDKNPVEELKRVVQKFEKRVSSDERRNLPPGATDAAEFHQLKDEVRDIRATIKEIADHLKYSRMPSVQPQLQEVYKSLRNRGITEQLAADLVQSVSTKLGIDQRGDKNLAEELVIAEIARMIPTPGVATGVKRNRVVALVGPTGVGKTTTIAKLAAIQKLVHAADVGLISADTYRIGAIEQLRTFAAIADIPMEVIYEPSEMAAALQKFREKDLIFIDTVGRSQRMQGELAELKDFIDAARPDEIHLVLSASTDFSTLDDVVEKFGIVGPDRWIFTKLDEAVAPGPLLSLLQRHTSPVSYVTTGQTVPDDIVPAEAKRLATMIYTGVLGNA